MRPDQIKFRGKSKKDGKWLYGYLGESKFKILNTEYSEKVIFNNVWNFNSDNCAFIVNDLAIDPDTIGQFTGLRDKNGREIYEGDIVKVGTNYCCYFYKVVFSIGCFRLADKDGDIWFNLNEYDAEVCGNIFDNKDLLED